MKVNITDGFASLHSNGLTERDITDAYQRVLKTAPPHILDEIMVSRHIPDEYMATLSDGRKVLFMPAATWLRFCLEHLTDAERFQVNAHGALWGVKITWAGTFSGDELLEEKTP